MRALVRDPAAATTLGSTIERVRGDLTDRESLRAACDGIDVVYNIAALYRQAGLPKERYQDVNARAAGLRKGRAGALAIVVIGREGEGASAINPFYYSLLGSTCAASNIADAASPLPLSAASSAK